jgi:hypothetical protein
VEQAFAEDLKAAIEAGVTRPQAAAYLRVSLHEIKTMLGES